MTSRRADASVPCWTWDAEPSQHRFVTHLQVPGTHRRVRLPAPMPETWVCTLLFMAFTAAACGFIAAIALGFGLLGSAVAAFLAVWATGVGFRPAAGVRLRLEAIRLLPPPWLDEGES